MRNVVSQNCQDQVKIAPVKQIVQKLKTPSLYYALLDAQGVVAQYSEGVADVLTQQLISPNCQYALFSATKTFTAIAILQLQEQQQLNIDDTVAQYLPQYGFLKNITIRHLLTHQSGINNPLPLSWIHLNSELFDYQGFSAHILKQKVKVKRAPGKKSAYSNLNYLLLGEVIEKASGLTYQQYIKQRLIRTITSHNSTISFQWNVKQRAVGYHPRGSFSNILLGMFMQSKSYTYKASKKWKAFHPCLVNGSAYGGLIATPVGVQAYLQALLQNKLLSLESKQMMFTEQKLTNGEYSGKALGWFTGSLGRQYYVCHAGGGGGFYCEIRIYPKLQKASFVLMNKSGFSDKRLLDKLDTKVLKISN